jgi:hypothetical protein
MIEEQDKGKTEYRITNATVINQLTPIFMVKTKASRFLRFASSYPLLMA